MLDNDVFFTVRISHELNIQMKEISKITGLTRQSIIRFAIHDLLLQDNVVLDFSNPAGTKDRFVLNLNDTTFKKLQDISAKYAQSMNSVVTAAARLGIAYFLKQSGKLD